MARSIHHLNFIVRSLEASILAWERILGSPVARRDELKERGVVAASGWADRAEPAVAVTN